MALDEETVQRLIADYAPKLKGLGGERWTREHLADPAPLFYFLVTGGTESEVLRLRRERSKSAPNEPVFLLAHAGHNSLPASLEVLARLQQDGMPGRILFLKGPDDTEGYRQVGDAVQDLAARRALQRARIGCVGKPSDWLVASTPAPDVVRSVWGPEVVAIDLLDVEQGIRSASQEVVASQVRSLFGRAADREEPTRVDLEQAVRVYLALKEVVQEHRLDAVTVRCFDLVLDMETTGCFALAQLNDEGIIAGCEGDLVSTVALLWVHQLVGEIPWMANLAQVDENRNTLWLAHCTVPRTIVEDCLLRSHFESGLGVGIQGRLPTGPVTLLRIGGRNLDRLWLTEGEMLQAGNAENLCRTQAEIRLHGESDATDLFRAPLGNHLVMVSGHHLARLEAWQQTMIPVT
jgi:L-fucose isomerase-like protein